MMFRQVSLLTVLMPAMAFAGGDNYFFGDSTSYTLGHVSAGNCNFMYDPGVGDNYAALNSEQWDSTRNCGRCAEVSCDDSRCSDTTSTSIVYIVDKCPECAKGDLDLSPTVFKQLTGSDPSRYSIKWKFVDCPVSGNIKYCTKSGSSNSWLAVQPANFAKGVASMKIANQKVTMVDSCYYFLLNGGANVDISAVDIELTSVLGETITETLSLASDTCTVGTANFGTSTIQSSPSQTTTSVAAPMTPAPTTPAPGTIAPVMKTTAVPTSTTVAPQTQQEQSRVTDSFLPLKATSSSSSNGANFKSGKVTEANESGGEVKILQSSETGFETSAGQMDETDSTKQKSASDIEQVTDPFNSLKATSSSSSSDANYKSGKVTGVNESGGEVEILQAGDAGVETSSDHQLNKLDSAEQTAAVDIEQVTTKSKANSPGTSAVVVTLVVLAVVGAAALAAVVYVVKKKKLDNKRIDRDMAMMRSFNNFSSPVRFEETIAKI